MRTKNWILLILVVTCIFSCSPKEQAKISNPIMEGYFADPSIILYEGKYYIYATIDPWGGDELAVFETTDFKQFEQKHINWPTKQACTSPTSGESMGMGTFSSAGC